jgi:signal transduction histidine kinase
MRWWLALAFALVAAVTTVVVAQVMTRGSESAFRSRTKELAAGRSFQAAIDLAGTATSGRLARRLPAVAERHGLALFVFDDRGRLVSPPRSRGVRLADVDGWHDAVASALAGRRYAAASRTLGSTVVALPLGRGHEAALVSYARSSGVARELRIVREQALESALAAVGVGALVGFVIALLIAARLRRVAAAAAAIEGGSFDTELQPVFGDEVGELAQTNDRMRRRLRASFHQVHTERRRLDRLLTRLHQGVVTVDSDLRVGFVNEAARRLLDTDALAEGDPLPDTPRGIPLRAFAQGLFGHDAAASEVRVALAPERTYALVGVPSDGDGAIIVITDVTVQERQERTEREFVQNAAHELRTPLTTIRAAVEALQGGLKDVPAERERFLAHIDRESQRLTRLIHALLVLARTETQEEHPRLEPVRVSPLLQDVAAMQEPGAGVRLTVECDEELIALTNRDLVWEALANLAQNAVKHTSRGRVRLAAGAANGHVVISVEDSGSGFDRDAAERVFERFFRAERREGDGFGLGLAIARQAITAVGGELRIDSQPGVGTTATCTLPRAKKTA